MRGCDAGSDREDQPPRRALRARGGAARNGTRTKEDRVGRMLYLGMRLGHQRGHDGGCASGRGASEDVLRRALDSLPVEGFSVQVRRGRSRAWTPATSPCCWTTRTRTTTTTWRTCTGPQAIRRTATAMSMGTTTPTDHAAGAHPQRPRPRSFPPSRSRGRKLSRPCARPRPQPLPRAPRASRDPRDRRGGRHERTREGHGAARVPGVGRGRGRPRTAWTSTRCISTKWAPSTPSPTWSPPPSAWTTST